MKQPTQLYLLQKQNEFFQKFIKITEEGREVKEKHPLIIFEEAKKFGDSLQNVEHKQIYEYMLHRSYDGLQYNRSKNMEELSLGFVYTLNHIMEQFVEVYNETGINYVANRNFVEKYYENLPEDEKVK